MGLLQALKLPPPRAGLAAVAPAGKGPSTGATPVTLAIHKTGPYEPDTQHRLRVTAMMSDGTAQNYTAQVTWRTSNEALVKVLPGGIVKVGRGTDAVTITAIAPGGKPQGTIDVQVRARLENIEIGPVNPLIEVGTTEPMTATGIFADGSRDDITHLLEWTSDPPGFVDFKSMGECVGKAAGKATVVATHEESKVSGFGKVTVFATGKGPALRDIEIKPLNPEVKNGVPVQFKAEGIFADGSRHEITGKVKWRSSHPDVLLIEEDTGLATPRLQSGKSSIGAVDLAANKGRSTTAFVDFPGIANFTVSPTDFRIPQDQSMVMDIVANLHGGEQMKIHDLVQATPADPDVASYDPRTRLVRGLRGGRSTTIEFFESTSRTAQIINVTVLPPAAP